jgi:hypothetical protein
MNKAKLLRIKNEMAMLREAIQDSSLTMTEDGRSTITSDPWFGGKDDGEYAGKLAFLSLTPDLRDEETVISLVELIEAINPIPEFKYIKSFTPLAGLDVRHRKESAFRSQISIIGNQAYEGLDVVRTREIITVRLYKTNTIRHQHKCCIWINATEGQCNGSAEASEVAEAAYAALKSCGVEINENYPYTYGRFIEIIEELTTFMGMEYLFTNHADG